MGKVYLAPKASYSTQLNIPIKFSDICDAYSGTVDTQALSDAIVREEVEHECLFTVTALKLLNMAHETLGQHDIELVNPKSVVVIAEKKKKNSIFHLIINALIYVMVFFGSAMSVMYFHVDVGMMETQKEFARILGSGHPEAFSIITIAYTIGLGTGMYVFFSNRKIAKFKSPSPIDLNIRQFKSDTIDYLREKLDNLKRAEK
ncbi:MAG: hypothetical protein FWG30_04755 [Eubacteriaceae bacterium]|nr:hypothetical protein [Eubacteriaceae bacterium]